MLKTIVKREIKEEILQSGKLPDGLMDNIKPRLPYSAIKRISKRTSLPYSKVQAILSQKQKNTSPNLIKVINTSIDLIVELWGDDALPFIWKIKK
jgi:hypothetical protein